jgi:putative ABC transport system substrate-binding protein
MKIGGDSVSAVFIQELQRLGYVEGQNLIIERYSAEGHTGRYSEIAREVVSTHPDLIFAIGTPLTGEFKVTTSTIPVVAMTNDPIRFKLISSLAHPGGNITGVSVDAGIELWGKRLELLTEAVPKARNLLFVSTQEAWEGGGGKATRETAQKLGVSLGNAPVSAPLNEQAYRRTFETIRRDQADGIMFSAETESYPYRLLLVELVQQIGIPAVFVFREQTEAGGLISYSADLSKSIRINAEQIVKILRGGKPSEIPYVQGVRFELVINLKAAKALGLELPSTLLARADEVIE